MIRRRDFIAGLGCAAAWPLATKAQQPDKVRRIGVLMGSSEQDSEARRWGDALERKLAELGWKEGIDLRIERLVSWNDYAAALRLAGLPE